MRTVSLHLVYVPSRTTQSFLSLGFLSGSSVTLEVEGPH